MALNDNKRKLNDKQEKFCMEYIKLFNATQAYINAYNVTYNVAMINGSRLLRNAKVIERIKELKTEIRHEFYLDMEDVIEKVFKIAFSDMGQYVKSNKGKIAVKDLNMIDTTLIEELTETRTGVKIKLKDSKWAMEHLFKYFDMFPEKWKRRIEEEKIKLLKVKTMGDIGEVDEGNLSAWMAGLDDETIKSKSIEELERMYYESIENE